jgi:ATP-binding cassette subfamily F protein 3
MPISLLKEKESSFVGKNGRKSTMIKAIMKQIEINGGSLEIGHNALVISPKIKRHC